MLNDVQNPARMASHGCDQAASTELLFNKKQEFRRIPARLQPRHSAPVGIGAQQNCVRCAKISCSLVRTRAASGAKHLGSSTRCKN
mmetsp:Transcript_62924/g.203914  ORF Transcript_62924/g.203914 Transcript_62924/m.203914 type:complete len:86 (-) Transcript_62924:32-289(-)